MSEALDLLRSEARARVFFAALAQSSLGTGAAYVGLLLIAYERFHSPWAISLILLADFLPAMFFAPLLGAATDRWSRRWCAVAADVVRAVAFIGIAVSHSFEAALGLALLAGIGTTLFKPAALASLPTLVSDERSAAATSLYGAIIDAGWTAGPGIAAALLVVLDPSGIMWLNGVTFAVSALLLAPLRFGAVPRRPSDGLQRRPSLFREAREGIVATASMPAIRLVISAAAAGMFFGGVFNVVELPFATDVLGAQPYGFSLLVAIFGVGFAAGSLSGSKGGSPAQLKRRYLQGLLLMGVGDLAAGGAVNTWFALPAFALAGFGNGLFLVHQRVLLQSQVSEHLRGRVFAVNDALVSWGFAIAFLSAGGIATALGPRPVVLLAGAGGIANAAFATAALRRHWRHVPATEAAPSEVEPTPATRRSVVRARLQATLRALLAPVR